MGTPLEDALDRIWGEGGDAPTGGVTLTPSTAQRSTALSRSLKSPQIQSALETSLGQWEAPPVKRQGPSGAVGHALNALGWAKSAVWSTAKEGIDLFQGEGFSGSDWWNQATTDYGFGNLIHDERDVVGWGLVAMSPFTMGATGVLGAGVLADNIWADRVIGFIGDVAVDPLTYMGGMNVIARGLAGAKKARMGLVSMQTMAKTKGVSHFAKTMGVTDDVARGMLKEVDDAILAGQKWGSMGGIARSLNKTPNGKLVAEALGFNPGLRLRMPFTGAVSQRLVGSKLTRKIGAELGLDEMAKKVKIPERLFNRRFENIPKYFRAKYTDDRVKEAMRVIRDAKRPAGPNWSQGQRQAALKARQKLARESPELADVAGRAVTSAVEWMPTRMGQNAARVALGASLFARGDIPMQIAKRVVAPTGSARADKLGKMFSNYGDFKEELDTYLLSGDPNKVAEGWMLEDYIRHARGRESIFNKAVRDGQEKVARRARTMGFGKEDGWLLSQLEEADILRLNADGVTYRIEKNIFYDNLDPRLKNMSDEDLLMLKAEMDSAREEWTKVVRDEMRQKSRFNPGDDNGNISGKWDAEEAIRAEEGDQFLHRKLSDTMSGDDWFGVEDATASVKDAGRGIPHSLKPRSWRVNGGVKIPDHVAEKIGRNRVVTEIDADTGEVLSFLANPDGTKFIIQDPRVVGRSVRRQIDEAMRAASGEDMFESDWFKLMDHGKIRMGREVRLRSLANRHWTRGSEFDDWWGNDGVQRVVGGWGPQGPRGGGAAAAGPRPSGPRDPDGPQYVYAVWGRGRALEAGPSTAQVAKEAEDQALRLSAGTAEGFERANAASGRPTLKVDEAADAWQGAQQQMIDAVAETKIARNRLEEIGERIDELKPDPEVVAGGRYRVPKELDDLIKEADGIAARMVQLGDEVAPQVQLQGVESAKVLNAAEGAEGPWTRKLLDADTRRQAARDAGEPWYAKPERIEVTGINPYGEILINYNHPWYSAHGERTAAINWGMLMDPMHPIPLDVVRAMPLERRVRWSMPVIRKVKEVADEMNAEGITVVADVALDRPDLLRLYERAGFVRVPRELMRHQGGREGMVEMVRRPTSQSPAATYRALNDAFQRMNQNFTYNVNTIQNEIAPLITRNAEQVKLADRTTQAMEDLGRAVTGTPGPQRYAPISEFADELDEVRAIDEVVGHNDAIDGVPSPQRVQETLAAASQASGEATQRLGVDAALNASVVDDAARGVNVSAGKRVVESVDAGALEARNAEALIADGAQDYEAFTQLELFDTDLAEAALVSGQANARDALEISAGEAPLERGGVALDTMSNKLFGVPQNPETAALIVRDAIQNWRSGASRGGRPPGGGAPPGGGGFSGMAGGAPWDPEFSALLEGFARINDPAQFASRDSVFWQNWDKFQNWLKAGMIATPGFVNRNIMGAFFNAWIDGVAPSEIFKAAHMGRQVWSHANKSLEAGRPMSFLDAARDLAKEDAAFVDYVGLLERGVRGGGQAVTAVELQQTLGGLKTLDFVFGVPGTKKIQRVSLAPWSSQNILFKGVRDVNGWVEDFIRLGVGMDTLKNGGSYDDALARIAKSQFDYSELTRFEQEWVRRFVPFYTWTRKNVPYQLKQLGAHPYKYNRLMAAKRNLELGTKEEGVVPDYYLEPFGIRMPFSRKGATVYSVPDLPFQDLLRLDPTGREGVEGTVRSLLWQVTPIVKTPIEVLTKNQMGSGIPFRGDYQKVPKPLLAMKFLMPVLGSVGLAKRSPLDGEWRMRDHHIYAVGNILPTVGQLRRIWPNEDRYQKRQLTALFSMFGGMNVQFNTPDVQYRWLQSKRWEMMRDRQDLENLLYPRP